MKAILLLTLHWYISLFFQTFFLHRYCSHQMFKLSFFWERTFYLLTYLVQGISFLHPRGYAIMHMSHHQNSDNNKDPHSPINHKNIISMMHKTYREYISCIKEAKITTNPRHTNIPIWHSLDNFAISRFSLILWPITYIGIYYMLDISFYYYPLVLIHCFIGPIQGSIVNWFGHKLGYQNFDNKDNSKNTLPLDLVLMGELYQNNHHQNANKLNFAFKWYELDLTYHIATILNSLGIIEIQSNTGGKK